jgi:hypothetical protein
MLIIPNFNHPSKPEFKIPSMRPDLLKKKLNSDIEKCHFLQNLSTKMNPKPHTYFTSPSDPKDIEVTAVETARFGKSKEKIIKKNRLTN